MTPDPQHLDPIAEEWARTDADVQAEQEMDLAYSRARYLANSQPPTDTRIATLETLTAALGQIDPDDDPDIETLADWAAAVFDCLPPAPALDRWLDKAETGYVALPPKAAELVRTMPDDFFGLILEVMDEAAALPPAPALDVERLRGIEEAAQRHVVLRTEKTLAVLRAALGEER